jgi:heat shock protein HtpX
MTAAKIGLQSHIWNNNLKSIGLLALYPFLIMGIVWAIAAAIGFLTAPNASWENADALASSTLYQYWPIILAVVGIWFFVSYFFHTTMIRKMSHSHPVTRQEEPELYNLFENLCISIGIQTPHLEIIESHARNAFASGIDQKSFSVTITRGLLQSLSKDEIEGVLAHELTHIQNRDVRLLIITIIFTGMIGFAAQVMWSQVRYGLWVGGRGSSKKGNGFPIMLVILAILWIGYFATLFTRFALSRRREYMADAGAIKMTKNPDAMMRALMRIAGKDQIPKIPGDITMMCIENHVPFMGLFATHPPIESRIQILSDTTGYPVPDLPKLSKPFHAPRAPRSEILPPSQTSRDNWTTRQRLKSRRNKVNPWY